LLAVRREIVASVAIYKTIQSDQSHSSSWSTSAAKRSESATSIVSSSDRQVVTGTDECAQGARLLTS
jgi:hypothetical protein